MKPKPQDVQNVITEVFKRGGFKRRIRRAEAVLLWPQVVGSEVALFSQAKVLREGVLYVEVPDPETSMHLSMQRTRFLDVYRAKFQIKDIKDIRFVLGRIETTSAPEPKPPQAQANPQEVARLARDLAKIDLPDDLAEPTMKAAKAMLANRARRLAQGWLPCPICDSLTPDGKFCDACQRYSQEGRVLKASQHLALDANSTTPLLSEEERAVAIYLARQYLEQQMQELLPQVLAEPVFKGHLESAAKCYLAHLLHKPLQAVSEEDFDRLDTRVARALGRWR